VILTPLDNLFNFLMDLFFQHFTTKCLIRPCRPLCDMLAQIHVLKVKFHYAIQLASWFANWFASWSATC